jgi:hypothetical protein
VQPLGPALDELDVADQADLHADAAAIAALVDPEAPVGAGYQLLEGAAIGPGEALIAYRAEGLLGRAEDKAEKYAYRTRHLGTSSILRLDCRRYLV